LTALLVPQSLGAFSSRRRSGCKLKIGLTSRREPAQPIPSAAHHRQVVALLQPIGQALVSALMLDWRLR
jgi:hypothetical protein